MTKQNENNKNDDNQFNMKSFWVGFAMFAVGCIFIGIGVIAGDAILDALGIGTMAASQMTNGIKVS